MLYAARFWRFACCAYKVDLFNNYQRQFEADIESIKSKNLHPIIRSCMYKYG